MSVISDSSTKNIVYFSAVCRICLQNDDKTTLLNLFETDAPEMLRFCGFLNVNESDGFPDKICKNCAKHVEKSYALKQLCISTKSYFQSLLDPTIVDPNIKLDVDEDDDSKYETSNVKYAESEGCWTKEDLIKILNNDSDDDTNLEANDKSDESDTKIRFGCPKCEKAIFDNKNDLYIHQSIHNNEFTCNGCKKTFQALRMLKRHLAIHMIKKKYPCKYCSNAYGELADLSKHIKHKHFQIPKEKRFECQYCGQKFVNNQYKIVHERKHTGEKPLVCKVCDKRFNNPNSLKIHLDAHTGIKKYLCNTCGKSFLTGSLLKQHQNTHSDQKTCLCDICNQYFSQPRTLRMHQKLCRKKHQLQEEMKNDTLNIKDENGESEQGEMDVVVEEN